MNESPLAEVVRDRRINSILEAARLAVRNNQSIIIEPKDIDYIQRSFVRGLSLGEKKLYDLVADILKHFEPGSPQKIKLITWGRCSTHTKDEPLVQETDLTHEREKLFTVSDTLLSSQYPPTCPECSARASTIASFIRHIPQSPKSISFIQTRIKTTTNLCYKIADMVFDIDFMFQRDKIYNEFSQVVTDIYGLKVITKTSDDLRKTIEFLRVLPNSEVVEEKDYTGLRRKKSGYEAYKTVVRRDKQLFEVQIQTEEMFHNEQNSHAANHRTYKEIQMAQRKKLGREYIALYKALSQLFSSPEQNHCSIEYIEIGQTAKGLDDEF